MALNIFVPDAPSFGMPCPYSPLVLADRLLTLAQEADRAGFQETASSILGLMFTVLDKGTPARS